MRGLISVEVLKLKRSLALVMMAATPLLVVVLNTLMMLKRSGIHGLGAKQWTFFWMGNSALWAYFMMPLYIALVAGLLNGQEHRNQSWRLMLTLPVSQSQLYIAKALLAWIMVVCSNLVLVGASALTAALLGLAGASTAGAFDYPMLALAAKLSIACLPVLLIQHAVAWRFQSLVLPLAVGVIATMGITQIGSSEYWVWYPWTYALTAVNGSMAAHQQQALMLALGVGAVLLPLSAWIFGRREVVA